MKRFGLLCMMLWASVFAKAAPQIGLDHIPLAVKDLAQATGDYRRLGFAIKPGRPHDDGIVNNHVKFPDGSGIELITAPDARDEITSQYVALLKQGEGPAFLGLHARDWNRFVATLDAARIAHESDGGLLTLKDGPAFLFFLADNRSPTDRPEHFAHPNGASAMTGVWIATAQSAQLARLFAALGATARKEIVRAPEPTEVTVIAVANGRLVLLPESRQVIKGRPIIGAEFNVSNKNARREMFVPPASTHGIWLHFIPR